MVLLFKRSARLGIVTIESKNSQGGSTEQSQRIFQNRASGGATFFLLEDSKTDLTKQDWSRRLGKTLHFLDVDNGGSVFVGETFSQLPV